MKIVAIPGSNSKNSINKRLLTYTSSLFQNATIDVIDLNHYEVALYGVDRELDSGVPSKIKELSELIDTCDLLIISLAEHNGTYSVAFKNSYDWLSRVPNRKVLGNKPVFLLATSPGPRGGLGVLEAAKSRFPRDGSEIIDTFSLPSFNENFNEDEINTTKLKTELINKINTIKKNYFKQFYKNEDFSCGIDSSKDDCGDAMEY
jgi:NAD(P)H-dependent FMN reductase